MQASGKDCAEARVLCYESPVLIHQLTLVYRFVWALVHSPDPAHVERGLDLAQQMLHAKELDEQGQDDLVYFCAVVRPC